MVCSCCKGTLFPPNHNIRTCPAAHRGSGPVPVKKVRKPFENLGSCMKIFKEPTSFYTAPSARKTGIKFDLQGYRIDPINVMGDDLEKVQGQQRVNITRPTSVSEPKTESEMLMFYKSSLKRAGERVNQRKKMKALKDVIGAEYEEHRKRIWEFLGFEVDKEKHAAAFDVDWAVYYDGKLVAFEEDKGHYVDSCFLERCLTSFLKTINNYEKQGNQSPILILSCFTKYTKYCEKLDEEFDIAKRHLGEILVEKTHYKYLNHNDRFSKKMWFKADHANDDNPYEIYLDDELIKGDIQFMLSLKN